MVCTNKNFRVVIWWLSHVLGLIIENATYGASEIDGDTSDFLVDVTIPLQALVTNSQLHIAGGHTKVMLSGYPFPSSKLTIGMSVRLHCRVSPTLRLSPQNLCASAIYSDVVCIMRRFQTTCPLSCPWQVRSHRKYKRAIETDIGNFRAPSGCGEGVGKIDRALLSLDSVLL